MMLVDSSVWIDYFNGRQTPETDALDRALGVDEVIIGDLMLTEVLQGFRKDADFHKAHELLNELPVVTMLGPEAAIRAAENYRSLRKHGVTVRKTIDVMIASYCIEHDLPLLYSDRDFDPMVEILHLQSVI
ncbi:PIN domain nuclease [Mariprofundus sp. EBB-1]|uniref:type II toxin-antitoxin system VapC family toxin n=1 Tax=Mariprofundus sp. EBB-1 TaxID=2650971 RepID=UPI003519CAFC